MKKPNFTTAFKLFDEASKIMLELGKTVEILAAFESEPQDDISS